MRKQTLVLYEASQRESGTKLWIYLSYFLFKWKEGGIGKTVLMSITVTHQKEAWAVLSEGDHGEQLYRNKGL